VEQIKNAIVSIQVTNLPMSSAMETDAKKSTETATLHQTTLDLPAIIHNFKHDIATIVLEMHALIQQATIQLTTNPRHSPIT